MADLFHIFRPPAEPELSEDVVYDFTVTLDDPYSLQQQQSNLQRKWLVWLVGGVIILLAIFAGVIGLVAPEFYQTPAVRTVHQYFDQLNSENFQAAYDFVEPGTLQAAQFAEQITKKVGSFVSWKIDYRWSFEQMKLHLVAADDDAARVKVDGYLRIVDTQTGRFMNLPYSDTLQLVKRNNRWYIRP